jgi:hypothetical protein
VTERFEAEPLRVLSVEDEPQFTELLADSSSGRAST